MPKYEIMYILKDNLEEEALKEMMGKVHAVLTDQQATIENVDEWGLRELAYPIDDHKKGYYVVLQVNASPAAIAEFDRLAKLNASMLRHLVTSAHK
jgi:small subunit ribosomal protein S6